MKDLVQDGGSLVAGSAFADGVDRRMFIKAALGSGFAAATLPVAAQSVIKTDSAGLTAGEIEIKVGGVSVPVYRAQPAGKTGLPVILVVSEIFGVHARNDLRHAGRTAGELEHRDVAGRRVV